LQVDNQLASVGKSQGNHAANPLVVDVHMRLLVEAIASGFQLLQQSLGLVHEFVVGHGDWVGLEGFIHRAEQGQAITIYE
jgi:hypothetical protein